MPQVTLAALITVTKCSTSAEWQMAHPNVNFTKRWVRSSTAPAQVIITFRISWQRTRLPWAKRKISPPIVSGKDPRSFLGFQICTLTLLDKPLRHQRSITRRPMLPSRARSIPVASRVGFKELRLLTRAWSRPFLTSTRQSKMAWTLKLHPEAL